MGFARRSQALFIIVLLLSVLLPIIGEARPEFINRHGVNRCTACHFSPSGGGIRNSYGKLYGAHGFKISKYASQDFISAEMRFIHYNPSEEPASDASGLFLMAGIVGGSVAINPVDEKTEVRAVLSHDVLNGAKWDSFVRFRFYDETQTSFLPQYLIFGRFHAPFGLLNDEHRTYTKMQTLSDYNTRLEGGAMISGQPHDHVHYDLAVVNGEASGAKLGSHQSELWGGVANLRMSSPYRWLPFTLGASYKFHDRYNDTGNTPLNERKNPWAGVLYGTLSLERLTGGVLSADILVEYAQAQNLNKYISPQFASATFKDNNIDAESEGVYAQVNLFLTERFILQYKYDNVVFNKDFPSDAFTRSGFGFKHYFAANSFYQLRFEKADVGHPDEKANRLPASSDAAWLYLQVGI